MKNDVCFIVGGGLSLQGFDWGLLQDKETIAVNRSVFNVPNPKYFITTDYTFFRKIPPTELNGLSYNMGTTHKIFVVNTTHPSIRKIPGDLWSVPPTYKDVRCNLEYDLGVADEIIEGKGKAPIGFNWDTFYTGDNSGFCAFQWAVLKGYKRIYLLGLDLQVAGLGTGKTHHHTDWIQNKLKFKFNLQNCYDSFCLAIRQVWKTCPGTQIISCSPVSKLNDLIPYQPIERILKNGGSF